MLTYYKWMVVVGIILMAVMGFGIGANDVANNFGSSVGSRAITLGSAILIAGVTEFAGAVLFGSTVTDSVRKGVITISLFENQPDLLMFGNLCALFGASLSLIAATYYALPVSTTHTVIGALVGFGVGSGNMSAVNWNYILFLVLSWILAPIISGIFGAILFGITRRCILRKDNAVDIVKRVIWVLIWLCASIFTVFFIHKNALKLPWGCTVENEYIEKCPLKKWASSNLFYSMAVGIGIAGILTLVTCPYVYYRANKIKACSSEIETSSTSSTMNVDELERSDMLSAKSVVGSSCNIDDEQSDVMSQPNTPCATGYVGFRLITKRLWAKLPFNHDIIEEVINVSEQSAYLQSRAEKFNQQSEKLFSFLQVLSAVISCLVHGANDVANATAPFATIWQIYREGEFNKKVPVEYWVLAVGGASIAVGLAIFGHKVIKTLGVGLVKITPSRGFSIEVGMATTMVIGTFLGLPLSTTQCQVGSTIAVGLIDKPSEGDTVILGLNFSAINKKLLLRVFISWFLAFISAASISGSLYGFSVYGPTVSPYYSPAVTDY